MKKYEFNKIEEQSPTRLSFANGGDTDYYINLLGKGNCINVTINIFSFCEISRRNDSKIMLKSEETGKTLTLTSVSEIEYGLRELDIMKAVVKHYGNNGINVKTHTQAPLESGLGGSASHTVSLIKAFDRLNGFERTAEDTARLAYRIEREELGYAGGYQDQWAAAYRGINYMHFTPYGVSVIPIKIDKKTMQLLEENMLLIYVKREKSGSDVHEEQISRRKNNLNILHEKYSNVLKMKNSLEEGDIEKFASSLSKDWELKKQLAPCISNSLTDKIYDEAMKVGSTGGRFIGAGAGGCAIFICKDKEKVFRSLKKFGIKKIPFRFSLSSEVSNT